MRDEWPLDLTEVFRFGGYGRGRETAQPGMFMMAVAAMNKPFPFNCYARFLKRGLKHRACVPGGAFV
jgi:hypothetical protein